MLTTALFRSELDRIKKLSDYNLDYNTLNESLNDLALIAAKLLGAEISLINLVDSYMQWTVAQHGVAIDHMPREESVCQYTIAEDDEFEVQDLTADDRFNTRDYVTGTGLKYYYGVPLKTADGHHLGAICVLDKQTRLFTPEQKLLFKALAKEVVNRLNTFKQIEVLKQKVVDLNNSKKMVAHDIRGPIGGIAGLANFVCEQGTDNELNELLDMMKMIGSSCNSVLDLANEILNADAEQTIDQTPADHQFNLVTLKEKILNLFTPRLKNKDIHFTINLSPATAHIPFSKLKLLQIAGNLISNAIKFTPAGGIISVELDLTLGEPANVLKLIVTDTGTGMDDEQVDRIMRGAMQSTNGTEGEVGYGLGLTLVKQLVDEYEGELSVQSQPGKGTIFTVCISASK